MIRLAMIGPRADLYGKVLAIRLCGASVTASAELPTDCDAVMPFESENALAVARSGLEQGKHALLPAGECTSHDELSELVEVGRRSGARLMVANPMRFYAKRQLIREQLAAGKLGNVGLLRSHRWSATFGERPGTNLAEALAEDLDLAIWLIGLAPNRVYAVADLDDKNDLGGLGSIHAHLAFLGGAMALIGYANSLPDDSYFSLTVIGSTGAAYLNDEQNAQLHFAKHRRHFVVKDGNKALAAFAQTFVDGLEAGQDFSPGIEEWQRVLRVVEDVEQSIKSGQAISREGS